MKLTLGNESLYVKGDETKQRWELLDDSGNEAGAWFGTREEAKAVVAAVNEREELIGVLKDIIESVAICGEPGNSYEVCQCSDFSDARALLKEQG